MLVQAHVAQLGEHLQSALTICWGVAVHQRQAQRVSGVAQREIISGSFRDLQRLVNELQRGVVGCLYSADPVGCLYSADRVASVRRVPHSPQNLAVELDCAPQEPQINPVGVSPPPPSRWGPRQYRFTVAQRCPPYHPRHPQHEVLRAAYLVSCAIASSVRRRRRSAVDLRRG